MFDVYCPDHGSRVLLFSRDIEAVRNTREGIEVHYLCPCGYRGVWRTGRGKSKAQDNLVMQKLHSGGAC